MTTETAALAASRTPATIRTWCRIGAVKAIKQAGRWVIDAASLARRIALSKERPMQPQPALTKTLKDGRTATVYRTPDGWDVHVDGKPFTAGQLHKRVFPGQPKPLDAIGGTPVVGFTDQEAAALHAVLAAERDAWKRSPRGQRHTLVADAETLDGQYMAARERAANTGEGWQEIMRLEKELNTAREAVGAFDAANPELATEIAAEAKAKRDKLSAEAMNRAFTD